MSKRSIVTASETEFHTDVSEEIDVDFNDKLNWLLLFRKRDDEIHFRHFKKQSGTKFSMVIAVVFFTFVSFYYKLRATEQFPNVLSYLNFGFALFAPVCLGWLMLALESKTIREKITWFRVLHREYESLVHSSWIFASCISQVIALFTGTYNGPCNSTSDFFVVNCLQDDSELSVELLVFTVSLPLILSFVAKAAEWKVVLGAWLLTNIGCITAIVWTDASNVVAAYIVTLFISTMILYENQRQNLFIFLLAMKQTQLLDEKVRNTDDSYVMEMKQMIGNVAHDLKTVGLSSYRTIGTLFCLNIICKSLQITQLII